MKKLFLLIAVVVTMLPDPLVAQPQTLRPLKDDKKGLYGYGYGYRKNNGNYIFEIKPKFEKASEFSDKYAFVRVKGLWGQIYKYGKYAIKPTFNWNLDDVHALSRGLFSIHQGKKIGVIDHNGKKILPCEYDEVSVCNRHALIAFRKNGLYGVANTNGTILIPPATTRADNIQELKEKIDDNVAFTMLSTDGQCYVIEGREISPLTIYAERRVRYNKAAINKVDSLRTVERLKDISHHSREYWTYFEESIGGQIYSHRNLCEPVKRGYDTLAIVKHQIDNKHYLYRNGGSKICFEDFFEIDKRANFNLRSIEKLSNGDYLIETSSSITKIVGRYGDYTATSTSIQKALVIVDRVTFKIKRIVPHPGGSTIFGVSNDGGWYMMGQDSEWHYNWLAGRSYTNSYLNHRTICKYNNEGDCLWKYRAPAGETIINIYESPSYSILSGSTQNKGYVGYENPQLVYLNIKTGKREHEQHITKKAKSATLEEHNQNLPILIYDKEIVTICKILNTMAYGLMDQRGNWLIEPVVLGGKSKTYKEWTIHPPQVSYDISKCVINKNSNKHTVEFIDLNKYYIGEIIYKNGGWGVVYRVDSSGLKGSMISVEEGECCWYKHYRPLEDVRRYNSYETEQLKMGMSDRSSYDNMVKIKKINKLSSYPAFKWCDDYGVGWVLPALDEWRNIQRNILVINERLLGNGFAALAMTKSNWGKTMYWSSSEDEDYGTDAICCHVGPKNVEFNSPYKDHVYRVRAILDF